MGSFAQSYIREHPIECMFFSEFHHEQGPRITYQHPEGYFNQQNGLFEEVTNYIIPKSVLQEKLTTVNTGEKKVIGCPVCLEAPHYPRNNYVFNFGVVLDCKHRSSPCIPMIRHLAKYMTELEKESRFVSEQETKVTIPGILKSMLEELNLKGSCTVQVNKTTTLYLKVFPPTTVPPVVRDHDVPLMMVSLSQFNLGDFDLTTERILPFIDGFRHAQKIAALADVDPSLTKLCIRDLAFYGIVELIPIFQYSNTYTTTSNLSRLARDKSLQDQCLHYITRSGYQHPPFHDVLKLYCGLTPDVTVETLCNRHQKELGKINERRLIQFGLIHEIIRRIHIYPVAMGKTDSFDYGIQKYCTGEFNMDEICCKTGLSFRELLGKIEQNPSISICRK